MGAPPFGVAAVGDTRVFHLGVKLFVEFAAQDFFALRGFDGYGEGIVACGAVEVDANVVTYLQKFAFFHGQNQHGFSPSVGCNFL